MAKYLSDSMMDGELNYWKTNGTEVYLCTSQPADRAAAIATSVVSKTDLTSGDYILANGTVSGRKLTANAQTGVVASATGTANHMAWCSGSILIIVTEITPQVVTSGNPVNLPAITHEIADVTP
jgi:hypothetical protein